MHNNYQRHSYVDPNGKPYIQTNGLPFQKKMHDARVVAPKSTIYRPVNSNAYHNRSHSPVNHNRSHSPVNHNLYHSPVNHNRSHSPVNHSPVNHSPVNHNRAPVHTNRVRSPNVHANRVRAPATVHANKVPGTVHANKLHPTRTIVRTNTPMKKEHFESMSDDDNWSFNTRKDNLFRAYTLNSECQATPLYS